MAEIIIRTAPSDMVAIDTATLVDGIKATVWRDGFGLYSVRWIDGAWRTQAGKVIPDVTHYYPPEAPVIPPPVVPQSISDRQFFHQLAIDGEITQSEALAAVAVGAVPQALAAVIVRLPEEYQFAANMFLQGATTFERTHPMTVTLAGMMEWDDAMLDALWTNAALL